MTDLPALPNESIANAIGSASFLLTAVALLLTAAALAVGAWAHWKAKQADVETTRLDLAYRLMLASAGGGDARLPGAQGGHYSSLEVQTMAIAALRSFPENLDVYERLLAGHDRGLAQNPGDAALQVLKREFELLVASIKARKS